MNVIIVEDEYPNAIRLQKMLEEIDGDIQILETLDGVANTIEYIHSNSNIDLIFLDLQLTDGIGLEILEKMETNIPVIFTTAYDQYAIDAYKYLSVDYLLKPIKETELRRSLEKFKANFQKVEPLPFPIHQLMDFFKPNTFRSTFICRRGKKRYPLKVDQIAYFFSEDRETWVMTLAGKEFHILKPLDQLITELSPELFFRTNRKSICSKAAIEKYEVLAKSKIKLSLTPASSFEVIISSEKSAAFKKWIGED